MPTIQLWQNFRVSIDGYEYSAGSELTPQEIEIDGLKLDLTKTLVAGQDWDAWIADSDSPITEKFRFLWVETDVDSTLLELTVDKDDVNGTREFCLELNAGIPLVLGSGYAMSNYATNFGAGILYYLNRIRVKNQLGQDTATVRVFLAY